MASAASSTGIGVGKAKTPKCRVCTDFTSWTKTQAKKQPNDSKECPPDGVDLGQCSWMFLHSIAAYYPESPSTQQQTDMKQFMHLFSKIYPCQECAEHMRERLKVSLPETKDRQQFSRWMCDLHNEVNERLDKPLFDCSKVDERWLEGWKDGTCD